MFPKDTSFRAEGGEPMSKYCMDSIEQTRKHSLLTIKIKIKLFREVYDFMDFPDDGLAEGRCAGSCKSGIIMKGMFLRLSSFQRDENTCTD